MPSNNKISTQPQLQLELGTTSATACKNYLWVSNSPSSIEGGRGQNLEIFLFFLCFYILEHLDKSKAVKEQAQNLCTDSSFYQGKQMRTFETFGITKYSFWPGKA